MFKFPSHHKTQRDPKQSTIQPEKNTTEQIEQQLDRTLNDAFNLLVLLNIKQVFKKSIDATMRQVSKYVHNHFKKSSAKADFLTPTPIDENNTQSDSDSEETIMEKDKQNGPNKMDLYDDDDSEIDEDNDDTLLLYTTNSRLQTMKGVRDTINPDLKDSYFLVHIDEKKKYLHTNTAIWYLTDKKYKLSSDRLNRVMVK